MCLFQCEIESLSGTLSSSDSKSLRLTKEISSLESQLHDARVTNTHPGRVLFGINFWTADFYLKEEKNSHK